MIEAGNSALLSRITDFPAPPAHVDLRTAPDDVLRQYGIPPRPSRTTAPEQYNDWSAYFLDPHPIFVPADTGPFPDRDIGPRVRQTSTALAIRPGRGLPQVRQTSVALAIPSGPYETSKNWCGAYIESNSDKTFVQISGQWVVPTPNVPPNTPLPPRDTKYASSAWVGLDGQRFYVDSSLPQTGTWQAVTLKPDGSTKTEIFAWVQWWSRSATEKTKPVRINGVPVAHGERVACMVRVWTPTEVAVYVKNLDSGKLAHFSVSAPEVSLPGGSRTIPEIAGATAEWVTERPTNLQNASEYYALADYGSVEFEHCTASEASMNAPDWPRVIGSLRFLEGPRLIRMYAVERKPNRTALISTVTLTGKRSVRATYGGFR